MKKLLLGLLVIFAGVGCSRVPAGNVGIKVYLLGGAKGVDHEVLPVGRYWIGMNEELYLFPTYQQNYTWQQSDRQDESFTFQTKEGMSVNMDVGVQYSINPDKIAMIFQKYRKGVDELTDVVIRNEVRDALNTYASAMSVEEVYSTRKVELFNKVQEQVVKEFADKGINIDNIYLIGAMRLPEKVVVALNSKIEATQTAMRIENEVASAKAEAEKKIAEARGEAEANRLKAASITQQLMAYEALKRWDGALPMVNGGNATPFLDVRALQTQRAEKSAEKTQSSAN